jgi:hypothetical protein
MGMSIEELSELWIEAKEVERQSMERRREIEDRIVSLAGIPNTMEGTETIDGDRFEVKIVGRMTRKVDGDKAQMIAAEYGLTEYLSNLFRWKPEINMTAWKAADASITKQFLQAVTTTPGRPSFTIKEK